MRASIMQVVNYERLERLRAPPLTDIPMDLNTLSVVVMILAALWLYRRRALIRRPRERYRT